MTSPSTGNDNFSSDTSPQPFSPSLSPAPPVADSNRPVRLVYCDEKGVFRMEPEAVAALQRIKGPVGVVSICGRAHEGKTFILNQKFCSITASGMGITWEKMIWLLFSSSSTCKVETIILN